MLDRLPQVLLEPGPFGLLWWQWIALPLVVVASVVFGKVAGRALRGIAMSFAAKTSASWDEVVIGRLSGPFSAGLALAALGALLGLVGLAPEAEAVAWKGIRSGFFIAFFWSLSRLIDIAFHLLGSTPWAQTSGSSLALLPLGTRVAKVGVFAIATVGVLSMLGYPVASLIAGLGIGGLALALAAQKTVENLFGAFSIGVDQPFRVGDTVKIEDFLATVESIGLRSTRFRTLDRTVVTIPNGKLADSRIESYTARDRMRLATIIGLVYGTTEAQLREVLAGFERVLRNHPKLSTDPVLVRLREFGSSSLNIEVSARFGTTDYGEFLDIRQEVLLQFMQVVEQAGSAFAFPTQTLHLISQSGRQAPTREAQAP